jgi:dephospho-CoA kinase
MTGSTRWGGYHHEGRIEEFMDSATASVKATSSSPSPEALVYLVALVGGPGSGKTTVAEYLAERGFVVYSISDIRRVAALVSRVEPNDFEAMRTFTEEFYSARGRGVFAEYALKNISARHPRRVVLEGLRYPESIEVTRNFCSREGWNVFCIGLSVSPDIAADRIAARGRARDPQSPEIIKSYALTAGRNSVTAFEYCDAVIANDQSVAELLARVDRLIPGN